MNSKIVYSIDASDIQQVAEEEIERELTVDEMKFVANRLGDYIDWSQAILFAIIDLQQKAKVGAKVGAGGTAKKATGKTAAKKAT